ncbi:MerR family transcriptional regulator [Tsukamurella sp. PLM1]|uniref:MerR family transcriptional regulator n=1 Tax=Tsukamurella sp. PLM1 TaxID=2929795 RepID=UPI00206529E8|nr:MerR family transcriptional regulator [Tsukamurella sp. PLM1]BDH58116.1 MerR family transcriptional regulator [Tsukamurella sp. PLM1]
MRIGDIARIAGVSTRAIRHYHRIGLVPEPARESNGYRSYSLDEVVLLLRIRRLVELGMSLDEIGDVLDDGERARDLDEVLAELDADLARQEEAIRERRRQLIELRSSAAVRAPVPGRVGDIADRIAEVYAGSDAAARMELAVMEVLTGVLPGAVEVYEAALDDPAVTALSGEIAAEFDALQTAAPDDPRVTALADRIVAAAGGLELPETASAGSPRIAVGDVTGWFDAADWMSDAQRRCIALMVQRLTGDAR